MIRHLPPLLLALATFGANAQDDDDWPTTKFVVFVGNPFSGHTVYEVDGSYDWIEFENRMSRVDEKVVRHIERVLHQAAEWYKDKGFPPPLLEPILDTEEGRAYRVYLCFYEPDLETWDRLGSNIRDLLPILHPNLTYSRYDQLEWNRCKENAAYLADCIRPHRSRYLYFNSDALIADNKLTELGHQTLAHELMHAIWYKTDAALSRRDKGCFVDNWIMEGIPEAIGWDMAEEKWANKRYIDEEGLQQTYYVPERGDPRVSKRWGYRPYYLPLTESGDVVPPNAPTNNPIDAGYHTSSFWRFVADQDIKKWESLVKTRPANAQGLLYVWFEGVRDPDWRSEVKWVDTWLHEKFKMGLDAMYAHFVSEFTQMVPEFKTFRDLGYDPDAKPVVVPDAVMDKWTNYLFEDCYEVDLSSTTFDTVDVNIDRLSARCLWVEPIGTNSKFEVTFHAGNDDPKLLEDIWISKAGTTSLVNSSVSGSVDVVSSSVTDLGIVLQQFFKHFSSWTGFSADGGKRTLFLITNVASKPEESKPREFRLLAIRPAGYNSFTGQLPSSTYVPPPSKPTHKKHAKTLSRRKSETRKMLLEQMEEDKDSMTWDTTHGSRIRRDPKRRVCPNPFKYSACGPQMHITLTLVPGTYMLPGLANTTGGMTAQFMGAGLLAGQMRLRESPAEEQEVFGRIDSIDGNTVYISTPYFDYGSSGTFDSAEIRVRMSDGKHLSAFGPPDHTGQMPLTGRVTIDEYTPFILRGSYEAPLAEMVDVPGGNPVRQPRQTISGTFTTVAPWLSDERIKRDEESEEVKFDEFMNTIGLPPGFLSRTRQDGNGSVGSMAPGARAGGDGSASSAGGCSCECKDREFADELCEVFCEEEFAACD